jgi:hypothetical protein
VFTKKELRTDIAFGCLGLLAIKYSYKRGEIMESDLQTYWLPIVIGSLWSVVWKGFALWRAAKNQDKGWFIALLVINTLGLLEIFYIFVFSKRDHSQSKRISARYTLCYWCRLFSGPA